MLSSPQVSSCSARRKRHNDIEVTVPSSVKPTLKFNPESKVISVSNGIINPTPRPRLISNLPNPRLYQKKPSVFPHAAASRSQVPESSKGSGKPAQRITFPSASCASRFSGRLADSTPSSRTSSPRVENRQRSSSQDTRANGKTNGRVTSGSSSPASLRSGVSRASTEEDLSVRVDKNTYQLMFQDIVSIKSMLLKLNRLLSESEGNITSYAEDDSTMDLKKQVAFLQQQLQQRETTMQSLQAEVNRSINTKTQNETRTLCNAATQTDRVRPVSTGPSLLQNLPSDANNIVTNGRSRKSSETIEESTRIRSAPAETIMEKVKALSFKPVEVVERKPSNGKNVFKITKIDLVLKSDNYGQSELRKT